MNKARSVTPLVLVSALGYFVDAFDIVIFSAVRSASLAELGVPAAESFSVGLSLLNWQMAGLLIGGILCGVVGDRRGRLTVLFGSIILYSAANFLNGFVDSIPAYKALRFIAGIGLSGELGVGVALVTEVMSPQRRGLGTMVIAVCGVMGSTSAGLLGSIVYWRHCFMLGGVMGFALLLMRLQVTESEMFARVKRGPAQRGSLRMLFGSGARIRRYLLCMGAGLPIYAVMGLLMTGAPEIGLALGLATAPVAGTAILTCHLSMGAGDVACSLLSQGLRSRRLALMIFNGICLLGIVLYLFVPPAGLAGFYARCAIVGFGCGFWALITTNAAEQFGTNLRATVATSVPNMLRGTLIPMTFAYKLAVPHLGLLYTAGLIGIGSAAIAIISAFRLKEKFGTDLDYTE